MESAGYLRNFRERWPVILLLTLVGLALAFGASRAITPTYSSTATMFLNVESTGASLFERSQFSLQRVKSYPDLVTSPELLDDVINELDLPDTRAELASRLSATNPADTVLLQIAAEADEAEEAATVANAAATRLTELVDSLENANDDTVGGEIESSIQLDLTIPAQEPSSAASPNVPVILALGLLSGIALGMVAAIVLERVRPRVRTVDDVRRLVSLPVVAQLPRALLKEGSIGGEMSRPVAAALDDTLTTLRAIFRGQLPSVLGLTPVDSAPGATAARLAIARALAKTGRRVAVVEADRSDQMLLFAEVTAGSPGLTEALSTERDASDLLVATDLDGIEILPAGSTSAQPNEYASEAAIGGVFDSLAARFDVSIVQTRTGVLPASLELLAPVMQGVLLVASYSRSSAKVLEREVARAYALGLVPIGVIQTGVPSWRRIALVSTWQPEDFITMSFDDIPEGTIDQSGSPSQVEGTKNSAAVDGKFRETSDQVSREPVSPAGNTTQGTRKPRRRPKAAPSRPAVPPPSTADGRTADEREGDRNDAEWIDVD